MRAPDPEVKISRHFTWKEALFLPKWYRMACDHDGFNEEVSDNLLLLFSKLDLVRDILGRPIVIHCAWRPAPYNKLVGGAVGSAHLAAEPKVAAVDFHVAGMTCDEAQAIILPRLEELGLRMEDNGTHASWIHLDSREPYPGHPRFFKP